MKDLERWVTTDPIRGDPGIVTKENDALNLLKMAAYYAFDTSN
jgi:hypothetical protein